MAKYRMEEMNDLNGKGERRLYPRLEIYRQAELKELAQRISEGTTFTPGDIMGVAEALCKKIAQYLADGCSVKLNGLGTFTPSLKLQEGCAPESAVDDTHHNARSIAVGGINFRPEKEFIRQVNTFFYPERSEQKSRRSSPAYTPEQRLALALDFLATSPYLTVADYCRLTGLLHCTASKELRLWAGKPESGITISGMGTHRVYILQQPQASLPDIKKAD